MFKDQNLSLRLFLQKILGAEHSCMIVVRDNDAVRQTLVIDLRVHKYYLYTLLPSILDSGNNLLKINRCN